MNKKRYLILIAFVIFVFLAVFTFANPLNKAEDENRVLEEIDENDVIEQEEIEKEEEKEIIEIKPVVIPQYNNHGVTINKTEKEETKEEVKEEIVEDMSYELALKAVEKVEITLSDSDYEKALELVLKVTEKDKKEELLDRISAVLEIIDLTDVVNTVVDKVNTAKSKEDMDAAREYVVTKDVEKRLKNLSNEVVKELLTEKLETIAELLDDIKAPTVNIEDEAIFDEDAEIVVTDDSEVTIILNDEEVENNKVVSDGKYTLTVIDASFNEVTIEFIVDTTAPEFIIGEESIGNGEYYSKLFLTLEDDNLKCLEINGESDHAISPFKIASEYYKNGENVLVATDIAGNETTFKFNYVTNVNVLEETFVFETSDEMITIQENETYVIDLNNNTYEIEERLNARIFENKGTLIIKNGKMLNKSTGYQYGIINNFGKLIVENVEFIDNANGDGSTIRNRGGEVIIKNSSFENTGDTILGNGAVISEGKLTIENTDIKTASKQVYSLQVRSGEATIKDVEVDGVHGGLGIQSGTVVIENFEYNAAIHYGMYITNNGEETNVIINNGTFNGELYGLFVGVDDGYQDRSDVTIIINNGTFKGNNGAMHLAAAKETIHNWNITINGGTFEGNIVKGSKYNTEKWNLNINGGKFKNSIVSDLTAEYEETLNTETGYYEVTEKNA